MENRKKCIVITLDGNALGNILSEQIIAIKITAGAIVDLIEEGCEVIVAHGNGPQVGIINNAMAALNREDANQPNAPLPICVVMSQTYTGYDLQNALRRELYNREMYSVPVATMITQVRVDTEDPALDTLSKPIGHFMTEEQAKIASEEYGYVIKGDAGCGYRRMVASPRPAEIIEVGAIRSLVDSGQLVVACGGGDIPATRQGNHLKGVSAVINKDLVSELLAEELNAGFLVILTTVEKVVISLGKPEEKRLDNLTLDQARVYMGEGHFAPGFVLPKTQAAMKFTEPKDGHAALITLPGKTKEGI